MEPAACVHVYSLRRVVQSWMHGIGFGVDGLSLDGLACDFGVRCGYVCFQYWRDSEHGGDRHDYYYAPC